jgi:outer membrane phospholipase A
MRLPRVFFPHGSRNCESPLRIEVRFWLIINHEADDNQPPSLYEYFALGQVTWANASSKPQRSI